MAEDPNGTTPDGRVLIPASFDEWLKGATAVKAD